MDCSSPFGVTRAYETLFSITSIHRDEHAHLIVLEIFIRDFYVLGFDEKPDRKADKEHTGRPRGNVPHFGRMFLKSK